MILNNNILYAGISKYHDLIPSDTGYQVQRIIDGTLLGSSYELKSYETPEMFIEVDDGLESTHYSKNNVIIANVNNEQGFDICINKEDLYTGKKFVRIHDGFEMGNVIYLGIDYSYDKKGRVDLPKYYMEVEDIIN